MVEPGIGRRMEGYGGEEDAAEGKRLYWYLADNAPL